MADLSSRNRKSSKSRRSGKPRSDGARWQSRFAVSNGAETMNEITRSYQKQKNARNDHLLRNLLINNEKDHNVAAKICTGKTQKELRELIHMLDNGIKAKAPDMWSATCDYEKRLYELAYLTQELDEFQSAMDAQVALRDGLQKLLKEAA